jgi:hypothetical protein
MEDTNAFLYSSLNLELVCSILNGIQITLKEALIENAMSGQGRIIRVQDFQNVKKAKIKYIDVLQCKLFETSTLEEVKSFY